MKDHPTEDTELDLPTFSHSSRFSHVFFFSFTCLSGVAVPGTA